MTKRSAERTEALSCILIDGLTYDWFGVRELNEDTVTATVMAANPDDPEDGEPTLHTIGPDDVARGLRMYREYLEGKREGYPGEWRFEARAAVRQGRIASEDEFVPEIHCRAPKQSYGWQTVEFDRTNGREGDYDANTADSVMQFAIYGHAVFG